MLRKILIPLDTSKYTPAAVALAADIARQTREAFGGDAVTLSGLGIVDLDQLPTGRFAGMVPKEEILTKARHVVKSLLAEFHKQATAERIPESFVETHHTEGSPFGKIIHHHVFCDVVVMGETCSFPPAQNDYNTFDNLFHKASRPILITPASPRPIRTVVMAMDGTAPASRMMYAYTHLNPFPKAKLLVTHSRTEEEFRNLKEFVDQVRAYLKTYKFDVEQAQVEGDLLDELPELVKARDAEAITLGIHPEHFLDKLRNPLALTRSPIEKLLRQTRSVLFTVN